MTDGIIIFKATVTQQKTCKECIYLKRDSRVQQRDKATCYKTQQNTSFYFKSSVGKFGG
jgi:hypothetical protein